MGLKTNLTDYIEAGEPTLDERLAGLSASAIGSSEVSEPEEAKQEGGHEVSGESSVNPPSAAEDKIDWKAHVARYHNGSFDPKTEHCEVYERMMKDAERDEYSPDDADGDGMKDEYAAKDEHSESPSAEEEGAPATKINDYFNAVSGASGSSSVE